MTGSFYIQLDENSYESTQLTAGPWSAHAQHAGPPSGLLSRSIEQFSPRPGSRIGRVHLDILAPVPVAQLTIEVTPLRMGRNVELLQAVLRAGDRDVMTARAWRLTATPPSTPAVGEAVALGPLPEPLSEHENAVMPGANMDGYMSAIDWRFVAGAFAEPGPARAWLRPKVDLVAGEQMTGWQRALIVADSASGISMALDMRRYPAINCDLSVVLDREPIGEWVGMDAAMTVVPGAGSTCTSTIFDETGRIGSGTQALFVNEVPQ